MAEGPGTEWFTNKTKEFKSLIIHKESLSLVVNYLIRYTSLHVLASCLPLELEIYQIQWNCFPCAYLPGWVICDTQDSALKECAFGVQTIGVSEGKGWKFSLQIQLQNWRSYLSVTSRYSSNIMWFFTGRLISEFMSRAKNFPGLAKKWCKQWMKLRRGTSNSSITKVYVLEWNNKYFQVYQSPSWNMKCITFFTSTEL